MISVELLIIIIPVIFLSISVHEMMHAVVAYWLGDDTARQHGRISLNPLTHIDPVMTLALPAFLALFGWPIIGAAKPVPFNPHQLKFGEYGAMLVALAGPLVNLFLAIVGAIIWQLVDIGDLGGFGANFLYYWVVVNLGFFVFNMIPIPPLDGSRVLYVFAPDGVRRLMEQLETYGVFLVIILFIFVSQAGINPLGGLISDLTTFLGL